MLLVGSLALARGVVVAALVPPLQAPDEDAHFDAVQFLAENGRLAPGGWCSSVSPELQALEEVVVSVQFHPERRFPPLAAYRPVDGATARVTEGCGPAGAYPPLHYATAALAYRMAASAPLLGRLLAVRLASVAWSCLGALGAMALGLLLARRLSDGVLLGILFTAQPMIGLASGTASNDAALYAVSTLAFAAAVAARLRPGPALAALGALGVAGALVKPTFLLVLPGLLVAAALALQTTRIRALVASAAALAPAALAGAAWQVAHPVAPLSPAAAAASVSRVLAAWLDAARLEETLVRFYWMTWGWLDTALPLGWYRVVEAFLLLAALGILLCWRDLSREERSNVLVALAGTSALAAGLLALEVVWARSTGGGFVQGRYLLPLFAPASAALVAGLRALARRTRLSLDPGWAFAAFLLVMEAAAMVRALARYHGPRLWPALAQARSWSAASGVDLLPAALGAFAVVSAAAVAVACTLAFSPRFAHQREAS